MNYYEALYGKCKDCMISTITLPGPEIRHYPIKDLEAYEQDILDIGKEKNTYINMWPRNNEILDDVRGEAGDAAYATCFFADYDVKGEAHKQENLPESKEEVIAYLKALPVVPTFIVDTGYGIDPIWCFKEPVLLDSDEIKKKAGNMLAGFGNYLIAEGRTKGWNIDNVFDAARMLRAPGSYNCKLGNKVECCIIYESGIYYAMEDFAEYCIEVHTGVSEPFEVDSRVVGSAERIMENCLAMQKLLSDPNGVNEQLWYALCTNAVLAKNGEEKFQEWSSPYLGYSYEETAKKIKHAQEQQKPCTCYYIKERLGFQCPEGGCGVKSPVVFSLYSKEEQLANMIIELNAKERVEIDEVVDSYVLRLMIYAKDHCPIAYAKFKPIVKKSGIGMREFNKIIKVEEEKLQELSFDMVPMEIILEGIDLNGAMAPKGYHVSIKNGVEIFHSEDGQMESSCLCDEPLVISRRLENIDHGTEKFELSFYRNGRWKKLIVPRANALNKNVLIRYADNGISVSSINAEELVNYLSVYESTNDKQIPFVRSINRIGWLGKEFYPCVVKDEIIFEDNEASEILSAICEHGSFEEWIATANKLRQSTFARAILAASFASPLLELLQHRVIILHLWHSSRSGKTAILKFALSVWGDPLKLMGNFNSTAVGLERRAGTLKHLPLGLDELQVLNEKRLSASLIVYSLGNGYGKTRGAKNGGLQDVPTWRNCIICTGEQPLSNENSMDGINSRVLEIYGQPVKDSNYGRSVHQISESNYGFAGKKYIQYLIDHVVSNKRQMRADFEKMRDEIKEQFELFGNGDPGAHLDNITVLSLADRYASISVFGMEESKAWQEAMKLGCELLENAKNQEKEDVIERAHAYVVDWIAVNRNRFEKMAAPCYGMIGTDKVYVISSELRHALEEGGFSHTKCMKGFRDRGYIEAFKDASGVERSQYQKRIQGVNVRAVCFNLKVAPLHPPEEDFLGEPIQPLVGKVS